MEQSNDLSSAYEKILNLIRLIKSDEFQRKVSNKYLKDKMEKLNEEKIKRQKYEKSCALYMKNAAHELNKYWQKIKRLNVCLSYSKPNSAERNKIFCNIDYCVEGIRCLNLEMKTMERKLDLW